MKATELRIGNYANWMGEPHLITAKDILWKEKNDVSGNSPFDFESVTLTEKWLLDFRFNKHQGIFVKTKKGGQQVIMGQTVNGLWYFEYGPFRAYLKHVHQLQNLYFALTGSELELKTT